MRQLFEPLLASASSEERAGLLAGAAELASPIFDPTQLGAEPDGDSSLAMLHGLFWLTANLTARCPVLLSIDDLHWCDPSSLRWLACLLPRLEGVSLLIVAGLRPAEPGADVALLRRITTDPLATALRPGALSEEATGEVIRQVFPSDAEPAFRAALHDASGGNPLLVRELANAVAAEGLDPTAASAQRLHDLGGQAVSRAVSLRLSSLSAEATMLARAGSILGETADPRHAAALAGLDESTAADAAADLERVEILRRDAAYAFVHPVVGAAVYEELAAAEKGRAHHQAADLLAKSGAEPERIAAQLLLAAPRGDEWAVSALRAAASSAIARGVPDSAVAFLRRALDEGAPQTGAQVLHELGSAEARLAAPEALEHLAAARAATQDARVRARIALELGRAHFSLGGSPRTAVEVLQEAIDEVPSDDSELTLELETQLIGIARYEPDLHALAAERLECLRRSLPRHSSGRDVVLANLASEAARSGVGRAEAIEHAERALAGGSLLREHFDPEFIFAVGTLTAADRLDEAFRLYGEAIEDAHERGLAIQFCVASCFRSAVALERGALEDAVADAELCLDVIESNGLEMIRPGAVAFLVHALFERGEVTRARQALDSASAAVDAIQSTIPMHVSYFYARARLRLVDGYTSRPFMSSLPVGGGRTSSAFAIRRSSPGVRGLRWHCSALAARRRHGATRTKSSRSRGSGVRPVQSADR